MAANKGKYLLVVEGAISAKDGGIYCKVGGRTAVDLLNESARDAAAVIALGSCASWGGMPSAQPNPTGCVGVSEAWKGPVVNIPGCPPNPYNFLSTVVHYLTYGRFPDLDSQGRPKFAYSRLIHENCERRPHFDSGRFAEQFGDAGHRSGWCLYRLGCKGPETYANCPAVLFGDAGGGSWPVGTGHPCIGCTEKGTGFEKPVHALADLKFVTSPAFYPRIVEEQGKGVSVASAAVLAGGVGIVVGAAVAMAKNLGGRNLREDPVEDQPEPKSEDSSDGEK
jgi:hydrogenase small subunit